MDKKSKNIIIDYLEEKISDEELFSLYNINLNEIINFLINENFIFKNNNLLKMLLKFPQDKKAIFDNMDFFISNSKRLLDLKNGLEKVKESDIYIKKINEVIDNNPLVLIEDIIISVLGYTLNDLRKENIIDTIKIIIDELLQLQNLCYHDIKQKGIGQYSNVVEIGDKILKIGKQRKNFTIKNNKRFLKPVYRQEIKSIDGYNVLLCIEITETVETTNVDFNDAFEIYKELRDQGLIWTDCKSSNLGRLIKDNKIYFDGINYVSKNATGYLDDNDELLKKGDIVIIDNDYIFTEEEFQKLCNNDKSLEENIYSLEAIADLEYQYQFEKMVSTKKC